MDNPDQRISEDINQFVALTLSLTIGLVRQLITLVAFTVILWNLSGIITVPIGSYEFTIYGYMVWLSLVYSIVGTYLTHKVGKALINLNYEQQKYEADFRFAMMRVRENTESIAFYRGEKPELENFLTRFKIVIGNFRDIMTRQKNLKRFYSWLWSISDYHSIIIDCTALVCQRGTSGLDYASIKCFWTSSRSNVIFCRCLYNYSTVVFCSPPFRWF